LQHTNEVRLFEIGSVYLPQPDKKLPDEPRRLALVVCGQRQDGFWQANDDSALMDFFDLKGVIEGLLKDLHFSKTLCRPAGLPALHPGRSAEVMAGGEVVGHFGELHPKVAETFGLGGRAVQVGEFDLETLRVALPFRHLYQSVPRFPAALRDIAIVVEGSVPAERVEHEIQLAGGALLRKVRLFDLYRGDSIPAGTKSLAYALTYQAEDRTLKDTEVDKAHKKIEDRLKHVLKAQIRGKT
jgi:phenylalanyl-tRNA synthetase beta chain